MRKPFHLLVFVLALALAYATAQTSGSSPSSQTPSQPSQDQTQKPETQSGSSATATATSSTDVQGQIQTALKNDPTLSNANITVSVTDDAVELTGTVASGDEKRAAKKIAKSYAGTRKVKDSLTVSGESKKSPPGTMGFVSAGAYSQSQSSQSGTAGSANGAPQSTSPSTSQSPPTPNEPANAQTPPGGSAPQTPATPDQSPSSQLPGSTTAAAGGDIQMQVQNALQKEPTLSNDNITVSVTDNTIELNGTVATAKEKKTATRIAQSYAGNRTVKEHLTVSANNQGTTNPPGNMNNPSNPPDTTNPNQSPSGAKPPRR